MVLIVNCCSFIIPLYCKMFMLYLPHLFLSLSQLLQKSPPVLIFEVKSSHHVLFSYLRLILMTAHAQFNVHDMNIQYKVQ